MRSKFERKAHKELEAEGWLVDYKVRPKFNPPGYNVDYWGLFDLIAYQSGIIRLIAIKGQSGVPKRLRDAILELDVCEHVHKEIWHYRKLKGSQYDKRRVYVKKVRL